MDLCEPTPNMMAAFCAKIAEQGMDDAFRKAARLEDNMRIVAHYVALREARGFILDGPK